MFSLIFLASVLAVFNHTASNVLQDGSRRMRYRIENEPVTWKDAHRRCGNSTARPEEQTTSLAAIEDIQDLNDLLAELPKDLDKKYWVAGYRVDDVNCTDQPFQDRCWRWYDFNHRPFYNSSVIKFSEAAKAITPPYTNSMLLSFKELSLELQLEHEDDYNLHPFICDLSYQYPYQPVRTRPPATTPQPCVQEIAGPNPCGTKFDEA